MKVSFPRMGNSHCAFRWLLEALGHQVIVPPEISTRTLDLGVRYAPEFACMPFKVVMGTYLEVAEQGAELLITSGGVGPCRAGYYWVLHQQILEEQGYPTRIVAFDPPDCGWRDFWHKLAFVYRSGGVSLRRCLWALQVAWAKLKALDDLEARSLQVRAREVQRGATTRALRQAVATVDAAGSLPEVAEALAHGLRLLDGVDQDDRRECLRVGLTGEIYALLEPVASLSTQEILGHLGAEVERRKGFGPPHAEVVRASRPYLGLECVGGHGVETVGMTVLWARKGFDGVVQVAPFGCTPEIVAKSILPRVSQEYGIPVMSLFFDEQTGPAGVYTRLEAFVDLLYARRRARRGEESRNGSLSRH
ncbi:MAG: CoA protein activase [Syntrophomonadaceae bacterium]|nr:CoA protein activase [Syntrophomonadaceae bacterium]